MLARERTHFEDFEFDGQWWLPATPTRKLLGTIQFQQTGKILLRLMGSLNELELEPGVQKDFFFQDHDRVFGIDEGGKPCTADRVRVTSSPLIPSDVGRSRAEINRLYVGAHFRRDQEILFNSQTVEFAYLEDWLGIVPFQREFCIDPATTVLRIPRDKTQVLKVRMESEQANLVLNVRPTFEYNFKGEFNGGRRAWFVIQPDIPKSSDWFESCTRQLGDFLTLCVGKPVLPRRIAGYRSREGATGEEQEKIEIFLRLMGGKENADGIDGLIPMFYRAMMQNAPGIIASWFSLQEKIEPVLGLLLGTYYSTHQYVETEFLTLMQALEIFHRRVTGGSYLTADAWQIHRAALTSAIPTTLDPAHKQSLKKRLEFGYEYSLRKRLQDLLTGISGEVRGRIMKGYKDFVGECADTRNALVHEGGGGIQAKGAVELWNTNTRLRALLNILIWKCLGLPESTFTDEWFRAMR